MLKSTCSKMSSPLSKARAHWAGTVKGHLAFYGMVTPNFFISKARFVSQERSVSPLKGQPLEIRDTFIIFRWTEHWMSLFSCQINFFKCKNKMAVNLLTASYMYLHVNSTCEMKRGD